MSLFLSNSDLPFSCKKLFLLQTNEVFKGTQCVKNHGSVFLSHLYTEITQSLQSNNDTLTGNHDAVCLVTNKEASFTGNLASFFFFNLRRALKSGI